LTVHRASGVFALRLLRRKTIMHRASRAQGHSRTRSHDRKGRSGRSHHRDAPVGSVVRVAAVDVASGTEVVVFGPATTAPRALEELAVAKLRRKLSTDSGR